MHTCVNTCTYHVLLIEDGLPLAKKSHKIFRALEHSSAHGE